MLHPETVSPPTSLPPALAAMEGCVVTRLVVDDSFSLVLCGVDREVTLRIDGEGRLQSFGDTVVFDPDRDPASVGALVGLLNQRVDGVDIEADGQLMLLIGPARLTVLPNDHQISWSVRGPDGTKAACIAEGRVVWE
jgi:hypothetical protein